MVAVAEHRERQQKYERKIRCGKLTLQVAELKNIKKKQSALLQKQAKELNNSDLETLYVLLFRNISNIIRKLL